MSRSNSLDAAAFRASAEYFLLNDLAIRIDNDKAEFYLALFQEHFAFMRNAETSTQMRNAHNKYIGDIQEDLRRMIKELPEGIKLVYDKDDKVPKVSIVREATNYKLG